jgi:hypothetical protein
LKQSVSHTRAAGGLPKVTTVSVLVQGNVEFGLRQVRLFVDSKLGEPNAPTAPTAPTAPAKPKLGRLFGTTKEEMARRKLEDRNDEGRPYGERLQERMHSSEDRTLRP